MEKAFDIYLGRITPPATQMQAAQRSHNALRDFLKDDAYFGAMIEATFLNGSYARNTVIRPIKDVDIIVVVGTDWLQEPPAKAMDALRRKLAQRYPERRTLRQRRAVRVTLYDMQLDVLLAVAPGGGGQPLKIPDRRTERWIETHPRAQLELTARLKNQTGGNYSRLVRLFKGWAASRMSGADRPSSFVLECSAFHVIAQRPGAYAGALPDAFMTLMTSIRAWDFGRARNLFPWGRPEVPDPALVRVNVADRWDAQGADHCRESLDLVLKRCSRLPLSRWDESEVDKWSEVFGDPFPSGNAAVRAR